MITLDIAEADDSERENRHNAMGEPYRHWSVTSVTRSRRYYWSLMIEASSDIGGFHHLRRQSATITSCAAQCDQGPPADLERAFHQRYASSIMGGLGRDLRAFRAHCRDDGHSDRFPHRRRAAPISDPTGNQFSTR